MKSITALAMAATLVLTGCLGAGGPATVAGASENAASGDAGPSASQADLTIEVDDVDAVWYEDYPDSAYVQVSVAVEGTLNEDGAPGDGWVLVAVNVTIPYQSWGSNGYLPAASVETAVVWTPIRSEGTVSPYPPPRVEFDAPWLPPVAEPYCSQVWVEVFAVATGPDAHPTASADFEGVVCTQTVP